MDSVSRSVQRNATTPNNVGTCSALCHNIDTLKFSIRDSIVTHWLISKETMGNAHAWHQQCWTSCANESNIVAIRFGNHGTKEMLRVVDLKVWPVSNFAQQLPTTRIKCNEMQQTDATCNIWQRWQLPANNVASILHGTFCEFYLRRGRWRGGFCNWRAFELKAMSRGIVVEL